jgi:hydrogenase maturation factor
VDECRGLGVSIIGGHTEVSPIERTIVSSTMIGFVPRERLARRPVAVGDRILLTKGAGIEGTSILASEMRDELSSLDQDILDRARGCSSMISVVPEAMVAAEEGARRMHDPTEGGVIGGLRELAQAEALSLRVIRERVVVRAETRAICEKLGIDPLKLISSGSLLCILPAEAANRVVARLKDSGISSGLIGRVEGTGEPNLVMKSEGGEEVIDGYPPDELWRVLS